MFEHVPLNVLELCVREVSFRKMLEGSGDTFVLVREAAREVCWRDEVEPRIGMYRGDVHTVADLQRVLMWATEGKALEVGAVLDEPWKVTVQWVSPLFNPHVTEKVESDLRRDPTLCQWLRHGPRKVVHIDVQGADVPKSNEKASMYCKWVEWDGVRTHLPTSRTLRNTMERETLRDARFDGMLYDLPLGSGQGTEVMLLPTPGPSAGDTPVHRSTAELSKWVREIRSAATEERAAPPGGKTPPAASALSPAPAPS